MGPHWGSDVLAEEARKGEKPLRGGQREGLGWALPGQSPKSPRHRAGSGVPAHRRVRGSAVQEAARPGPNRRPRCKGPASSRCGGPRRERWGPGALLPEAWGPHRTEHTLCAPQEGSPGEASGARP